MAHFCNSTNFLKSAQFKLILDNPEHNIEFFVQECSMPGWSLGELEMNWMAQNQQRPGDNITWNPLNATILCDEELKAFIECQNYLFRIKNPETGVIGPPAEVFDAKLLILTNKNNYQHMATFYDTWIQNTSDMMMSHTTSEDDPVTFTVDMVYDYYKIGI